MLGSLYRFLWKLRIFSWRTSFPVPPPASPIVHVRLVFLFSLVTCVHLFGVKKPAHPHAPPREPPIDVVYTWVDGSDSQWRKNRDRLLVKYKKRLNVKEITERHYFHSRDELKYSLRSIYRYAPFVRHIYIVTAGQHPSWLKEHPQISVIDHKQIFRNQNDLPTFNSHAIESNLHRIPGLADHFIYFNDDAFLGSRTDRGTFFTSTHKIRVFHSREMSPEGPIMPGELPHYSAWKRTNMLLNKTYKKERRRRIAPGIFPMSREAIRVSEKQFPGVFRVVSSHHFRMPTDCVMTNGLVPYVALYKGLGVASSSRCRTIFFSERFIDRLRRDLADLKRDRSLMFCLQDLNTDESPDADRLIHRFLEEYFPHVAPWEVEKDKEKK